MALFSKKEANKPAEKKNEPLTYTKELANLLQEYHDYDADYGTTARTSAVKRVEGYLEYRRAERLNKSEWEVKTVKVFDYTGLTEDQLRSKDLDSLTSEEQDIFRQGIVFECKTHTVKKDGEDISRFNFVAAMSILADLESKTLGNEPAFSKAQNNTLNKYQELVDLDPESEVAQADYYSVPHFTKVAEWNEMAWDMEAVSRRLRFGRMVEDGRYSEADLHRAYKNREDALVNPPEDADLPSTLRQVFKGAAGKNMDVFLSAVTTINKMNEVMDRVNQLFITIDKLNTPYMANDAWEHLEHDFTAFYDQAKEAENAGAMVKTVRQEVSQAEIATHVLHGQMLLQQIVEKPEKASSNKDAVKLCEKRIKDICQENGYSERIAAAATNEMSSALHGHQMDLSPVAKSLRTLFLDYREAHKKWEAEFKKNPKGASENAATLADAPKTAPKQYPKASLSK